MTDPLHDDPANGTRGPLRFFFARDERRLIVPKYHPAFGWTFHFADPAAPRLMAAIMFPPALITAGLALFR